MSLGEAELAWVDRDRHALLTLVVLTGLVAAVAFAVVGLPPFGVHAPPHYLGVMGPSCGLTRGTVALVRGSLDDAMRFNPASPLVALGGLAVLARRTVGAATGRWLDVRVRVAPVGWAALTIVTIALALNQQLHADLLR